MCKTIIKNTNYHFMVIFLLIFIVSNKLLFLNFRNNKYVYCIFAKTFTKQFLSITWSTYVNNLGILSSYLIYLLLSLIIWLMTSFSMIY